MTPAAFFLPPYGVGEDVMRRGEVSRGRRHQQLISAEANRDSNETLQCKQCLNVSVSVGPTAPRHSSQRVTVSESATFVVRILTTGLSVGPYLRLRLLRAVEPWIMDGFVLSRNLKYWCLDLCVFSFKSAPPLARSRLCFILLLLLLLLLLLRDWCQVQTHTLVTHTRHTRSVLLTSDTHLLHSRPTWHNLPRGRRVCRPLGSPSLPLSLSAVLHLDPVGWNWTLIDHAMSESLCVCVCVCVCVSWLCPLKTQSNTVDSCCCPLQATVFKQYSSSCSTNCFFFRLKHRNFVSTVTLEEKVTETLKRFNTRQCEYSAVSPAFRSLMRWNCTNRLTWNSNDALRVYKNQHFQIRRKDSRKIHWSCAESGAVRTPGNIKIWCCFSTFSSRSMQVFQALKISYWPGSHFLQETRTSSQLPSSFTSFHWMLVTRHLFTRREIHQNLACSLGSYVQVQAEPRWLNLVYLRFHWPGCKYKCPHSCCTLKPELSGFKVKQKMQPRLFVNVYESYLHVKA